MLLITLLTGIITCTQIALAHATNSAPQIFVLSKPIIIKQNTTLAFTNTIFINLAEHPFVLVDNTSTLKLKNCTIVLNDDYSWTTGTLYIKGICHIIGPHIWNQKIHSACIIGPKSTLSFIDNTTFYYQPTKPEQNGIIFTNDSSTLTLENSHIRSGLQGLSLTKGTIDIQGNCTVHAENNDPRYGISFGSGQMSSENISLQISTPGARLLVTAPYFQEKRYISLTKKTYRLFCNTLLALTICAGTVTMTTQLLKN